MDQTAEKLWHEGICNVGITQGATVPHPDRPVQIASVQTLMRRILPDHDLVIIDEAHRWFEFYEKWFLTDPAPIVGLSATPWTKGLGKSYDDLIVPTSMRELQKDGFLVPERVKVAEHVDLSDVKTVAGDSMRASLPRR